MRRGNKTNTFENISLVAVELRLRNQVKQHSTKAMLSCTQPPRFYHGLGLPVSGSVVCSTGTYSQTCPKRSTKMAAPSTTHTRRPIRHTAMLKVRVGRNDPHWAIILSSACRKDTRVPHEVQEGQKFPLLGPCHPAGAMADKNMGQSFCRHAWYPFVSNGAPGRVRCKRR